MPGEGTGEARSGVVRIVGKAAADEVGEFHALGTTLFAAANLFKFDRARLEAEFSVLSKAGVFDYYRLIVAGLIGESWADREMDARWSDWEQIVGGTIDLGYDTAGQRVHLTLLGGIAADSDTPEKRDRIIDGAARIINARPHKIFVVEIANEAYDNGPDNAEVQRLYRRLKAQVSVPVTLSAPANDLTDLCDLYGGVGADLATLHVERETHGDGGVWEPCWKPFEYPWGHCSPPKAFVSSEPAGPWSTVYAEFDPLRLVMAAATCWLSGGAGYVLHCGPGIRSGGSWDQNRGIPASLADTPKWNEIIAGLRIVKALIPAAVQNGSRINGHWDQNPINFVVGGRTPDGGNPPFDRGDIFKALCVLQGQEMTQLILALRRPLPVQARHAMTFDLIDPMTGSVRSSHRLNSGDSLTLTPATDRAADGDALILRGKLI